MYTFYWEEKRSANWYKLSFHLYWKSCSHKGVLMKPKKLLDVSKIIRHFHSESKCRHKWRVFEITHEFSKGEHHRYFQQNYEKETKKRKIKRLPFKFFERPLISIGLEYFSQDCSIYALPYFWTFHEYIQHSVIFHKTFKISLRLREFHPSVPLIQ